MLVTFKRGDARALMVALALSAKVAESAKKHLDRLNLDTMLVDGALTEYEYAGLWISERGEPDDTGEMVGDHEVDFDRARTLKLACSVYLEELTKVSDKQLKLFVDATDTNARADHVRNLVDRLNGQLELGGPAFAEAVGAEMRKSGYDVEVHGSSVHAKAVA